MYYISIHEMKPEGLTAKLLNCAQIAKISLINMHTALH